MVGKMSTELVEAELVENVKFNFVLQNTSPLYFTMNVEHNGMSMIILFCNLQDLNFWESFSASYSYAGRHKHNVLSRMQWYLSHLDSIYVERYLGVIFDKLMLQKKTDQSGFQFN